MSVRAPIRLRTLWLLAGPVPIEKAADAMAETSKTTSPVPTFASRGSSAEIEQGTGFAPKFDAQGLIPAIVTDARSGDVVMFAWMNALALQRTIETGWATYWSRSRGGLWVKGETSSNRQKVVELRTDCDQDAIWIKVEVEGHGASCHTGHVSCFYRAVPVGQPVSPATALQMREGKPIFDAGEVYGKKG